MCFILFCFVFLRDAGNLEFDLKFPYFPKSVTSAVWVRTLWVGAEGAKVQGEPVRADRAADVGPKAPVQGKLGFPGVRRFHFRPRRSALAASRPRLPRDGLEEAFRVASFLSSPFCSSSDRSLLRQGQVLHSPSGLRVGLGHRQLLEPPVRVLCSPLRQL